MSESDRPLLTQRVDTERLLAVVRTLAREMRQGSGDIERLGPDHGLEKDFGLDSLARVELIARIEREFGVRLPVEAMAEAETPRELLRLATGARGEIIAEPIDDPAATQAEGPPQDLATLTALLDWHIARHPQWTCLTLYDEHERAAAITYRQIGENARTLAAGLMSRGIGGGARIAIMLPTSREFFAAFYGALYAGCVPVPLYPPTRPAQREDHLKRIAGILASAGAALLVADEATRAFGDLLRSRCPGLKGIATADELGEGATEPLAWPRVATSDIAFLQYTSGSTGNPKGVTLCHANLLANLRAMHAATGITPCDVFVSWLPLYHDMGLIGAVLGSLCIGFPLILMPPLAFLARPARWLQAIHRHHGTVSAAPNFAYELCAGKIDDRDLAGLDLSAWRIAFNGAEPVSPRTIARFTERFAACGFRAQAMTPVYGLAENSLGLCFPPPGRGPLFDSVARASLIDEGLARPSEAPGEASLRIVSCGLPLLAHALRIVDASGTPLPERRVGRVQFRGPSATAGYFGNPEASEALFDGEWLRSGDLGYLAGGELYLTGREKDIIIRGGHNIYPQELEDAISRLADVRRGGVAVFPASAAESGTERLVVLAETMTRDVATHQRLHGEINELAIELTGIPADDIVLAPPHTVRKTSSGKVRRNACREAYESGALRHPWGISAWRPAWVLDGQLARECRARLAPIAGGLWTLWAWSLFLLLAPPAWLSIVLLPTLALRRRGARAFARLLLRLAGLAPRVQGLANLGGDDPQILVCNHASYLDALVLVAVLPPRLAYVAKRELLSSPLAALPLRRLGCVVVERFDGTHSVEDAGKLESLAAQGRSLLFFAEGTFRETPGLLPFRLGAFVAAAHLQRPVVGIALSGTRRLLPGESRRPRFSRLRLDISAPMRPQDTSWDAAPGCRDAARAWIAQRIDEPDAGA